MRPPPLFFPLNFFYQNDSEWPEMDFEHNFKMCNIWSAGHLLHLEGNIGKHIALIVSSKYLDSPYWTHETDSDVLLNFLISDIPASSAQL